MLFNSAAFAVFWVVVYGLYLVLPHRWQNWMLLAASYAFYGAWDWRFLLLLSASALIDYAVGLALDRTPDRRTRRLWLTISVCANLSILGFFKYYDFFAGNLAALLTTLGLPVSLRLLHVVLPVGISFYTFQSMSYAIDVYRGELKPTRNLRDFLLFVSFFPHLVAGPIMRAGSLLAQIVKPRRVTASGVAEGCFLIFWGLFLKVYVADNLAALVNPVFAASAPYNGADVLLAVYAFAFQIYGDFAGYSNIARGLGKCMGFELMVNFSFPYTAANPREFWRRWHISLSNWLRDYVYVPLGGSRRGAWITYRNLALTMTLGGLWHGAAWTFVAWGAYQAMLIISFRTARENGEPAAARPAVGAWLRVLFFFQLTCVGWLLFRATSIAQAAQMLYAVAFAFGPPAVVDARLLLAILLPLFLVEWVQIAGDDVLAPLRLRPAIRAVVYVSVFYLLIVYGAHHHREFIYFQF